MPTECEKNMEEKHSMRPCPWCRTAEHLRVECDLASLNSLEYWIECSNCHTVFYGRQKEDCPASSEEEIIERWNDMGDIELSS